MSDIMKRLEQATKTSRTIKNEEDRAMQDMVDRKDYGGRLGDLWESLLKTKWIRLEVAEAVINDIQQEHNKKLTQIVETLSEPSKFMTEYGRGRLSLACELLGIPKECQPCPILTKCPCNHEFGHCSWKETFKEAELLGKPQTCREGFE